MVYDFMIKTLVRQLHFLLELELSFVTYSAAPARRLSFAEPSLILR